MTRPMQAAWLKALLPAAGGVAILLTTWSGAADAQKAATRARADAGTELHWWPVRDDIWILVGAGANITASVGPDGVFLVNAGDTAQSEQVLASIKDLQSRMNVFGLLDARTPERGGAETRSRMPINTHAPPKPIRYIVDTSALPHNTGGNEYLAAAGVTYSGGNIAATNENSSAGAAVLAQENVLARMVMNQADFGALPTETYFTDEYKLSTFFNGEGIRLVHIPNATTDGDSIVYFRGADVIAAGDLFNMDSFPVIDIDQGGSINGVLDGLNYILKLAIPEFRAEGGTMVVPGQGRLADSADVGYYRDMLTIIRDEVQALIEQGLSLEQVIEKRPAFGYEGRFGSRSGSWTTDMFIEAVYRSLKKTDQTPKVPGGGQ